MKGTVQIDSQPSKEMFFWGAKAKSYFPKVEINRKIIRLMGFSKKGVAFHIGLINDKTFFNRYGYAKWIIGAVKPLKELTLQNKDIEMLPTSESKVKFKAKFVGEKEFTFEIYPKEKGEITQKLLIDGQQGRCLVVVDDDKEWQKSDVTPMSKTLKEDALVLSLNDNSASQNELTGGKGSSLANLMKLSSQLSEKEESTKFNVPKGIVVTTNAYDLLLKENQKIEAEINKLQELAWSEKRDNLKTECENVINLIKNEKLPLKIRSEIEAKLRSTFNDYSNKLFAVRSSAAGEDSEEMSAAGQMTTYLGVKGINQICDAVMKCWASQFDFVPVEYKRGYGQLINSPMAVVIQEMVNCDAAGVIFTADPVTGDERFLTVTANYGLGETVVSASAEPDTIQLEVNIEGNSLSKPRYIKGITSKIIGSKKKVMKLGMDGGTVEEEIDDRDNCCVDEKELIRLGELALKVKARSLLI